MTVWHIEIITQGDRETALHGYYTSRKGLWIDNKETIPVSLVTLNRHDWRKPYDSGKNDPLRVIIRKGQASTTSEVVKYNETAEQLEPYMFEEEE